ncbi:hypothetical protein EV207_1578 [Scopulibacillus darangshiensis]|uniref:Uncharacterized protein n=1 Tax=Scopulibacillus darangshiensis TaxID=442528 RepID=A0A4R2NFQ5_9BACL|nr:hypothetical protein [Scopulibacillus darangshiensis]TCP19934.1 hypothetical protein EV207_1578 [Scopulibacillus darangshiensis]
MLYAKNTPNNAGVMIYGDNKDFEALYAALHAVVGEEGEFASYEGAYYRVLGVCYDIRHALMGDREIEFVDNGMDQEKMRRLSMISNDKNVYLAIHVLWPEMLFVTMALNDFVRLYAMKKSKKNYDYMLNKRTIWDAALAHVRMLQSAIAEAIKETVTEAAFSRTMNLMIKDYTWFDDYATQYVDLLNIRFLEMDREKRLKNITIMAKRLAEKGTEYQRVRADVIEAAGKYNCSMNEIRLNLEFPEEIDW